MDPKTTNNAATQKMLVLNDAEDKLYLDAIQDPEIRQKVALILIKAGLLPL